MDPVRAECDARLAALVECAWSLHDRAKSLSWVVRPSIPILYFGDRSAYLQSKPRVISVGLNPSSNEFPQDSRYLRFSAAESCRSNGTLDIGSYLRALDRYFYNKPYTTWFRPSFEPVLNGLGASYWCGQGSTALHTDLCSPLATSPTWSRLGRSIRRDFLQHGVSLWHDLVDYLAPDIILIWVAREHLESLKLKPISRRRKVRAAGDKSQYASYWWKAKAGDSFPLIVFGRAAQLPFAFFKNAEKQSIGRAIRSLLMNARAHGDSAA